MMVYIDSDTKNSQYSSLDTTPWRMPHNRHETVNHIISG